MVDFNSNENWPRQQKYDMHGMIKRDGYKAFCDGKSRNNPWPAKTLGWQSWEDGWLCGEAEQKPVRGLTVPPYAEIDKQEADGNIKVSDVVSIKPCPLNSVHFGTALFKDGVPIGKIVRVNDTSDKYVQAELKIWDASLQAKVRDRCSQDSSTVQYKGSPELPRRMWVNQPSTFQPYHQFHGMRVIAIPEHGNIMRVYPVEGDTISMQMNSLALSEGWPTPKQEVNEYAEVSSAAWASIYDFLKDGNQALNDETLDKLVKNVAESIAIVANVPVHMLLGPALKK